MSKSVKVLATYKTNEGELFQCSVSSGVYPDAIDEARAQAVRGVRELLADALAKRYTNTDE